MAMTYPDPPEWAPLIKVLGPAALANYMFMGIDDDALVNGARRTVHLYKNRLTRAYLILDDQGRSVRLTGDTDRYEVEDWTAAAARHAGLLQSANAHP